MTAVPILVADAITTEINSESVAIGLPTGITARRSYADWDENFEGLRTTAIDVVFAAANSSMGSLVELESAGWLRYRPMVDIAIRKRFEQADRDTDGRLLNASVDPCVTLLQSIHEHFVARRNSVVLDDLSEASWIEGNVMSWVNQRKLRQGMFEGVVRIKFDYRRAI
jgi:hypothetical protein